MELTDSEIILLIDTIDRRIEQIKHNFAKVPSPLILISLRQLRNKLEEQAK